MKIYTLWVTRTNEPDVLELVDAWDENLVEAEQEAYDDVRRKWELEGDVASIGEVILEVATGAIGEALRPARVVIPVEVVE